MKSLEEPKRFSRARWLAGVLLVLALGPLLLWWALNPWGVVYPIERYMPDHCAAALRMSQPRLMWQSHWQGPGRPDAENALRKVLEANGEWQEMVKEHGEIVAKGRLSAMQSLFFEALGDEAWIVFGEWNSGGKPGEGQVGLVAFVRGDGARTAIGPRGNEQPSPEQAGQRWRIAAGLARVEHEGKRGGGKEERHPRKLLRQPPRGDPDQHQHDEARDHGEPAVNPRMTILAGQHQPQRVERMVVVMTVKLENVPRLLRRARPLQREQLVEPEGAAPGDGDERGADQDEADYDKPDVHGMAASNCRK